MNVFWTDKTFVNATFTIRQFDCNASTHNCTEIAIGSCRLLSSRLALDRLLHVFSVDKRTIYLSIVLHDGMKRDLEEYLYTARTVKYNKKSILKMYQFGSFHESANRKKTLLNQWITLN